MTTTFLTERLTPAEVARELDVTVGTLAVWRTTKRYPLPWFKIGRQIFYRRSDVQAFVESRMRGDSPVAAA